MPRLHDYINEVRRANPGWKSSSRIRGRAAESYCAQNLRCVRCGSSDWLECATNERSRDQACAACEQSYQIKCKDVTQTAHNRIVAEGRIRLLGAEYNTTIRSIASNIDYFVLLYDSRRDFEIVGVVHVGHANVTRECVIPRRPLAASAKRAGWQGCNLEFRAFDFVSHN